MATSGNSLSILAANSSNALLSSQTYQLPRSQSSPARGTPSRRYAFTLEDEATYDASVDSDENVNVRSYANTRSASISRQTKQRDASKALATSQSAKTLSKNKPNVVYIDPIESLLNEYEDRRKKIVMQKTKELLEEKERKLIELKESIKSETAAPTSDASDLTYMRDMFADHQRRIDEIKRVREERLRERLEVRNMQRITLERDERDRQKKEQEEREQLRLAKEKQEKERLEKERLEKERLEKERLEKERLEKEKKEKDEKEKAAAEAQKREEQQKLTDQRAAASTRSTPAPTANTPPTTAVPSTAPKEDEVAARLAVLERVGAVADTFVDKKLKMNFQGRINTIINQLSMDRAHTLDRIGALKQIFSEAASNPNQAVYYFCMRHFATKIVNQENVESAPHTAFPIAFVMVALSNHIPEIGDLIIATFYTRCPYTIPSYKISKDVKDEQESREAFYSRMTGFMILFAAFIQTPPIDGKHPYSISYGWRWMSRVLNHQPKAITATLLLPFLKIAGYELERRYGRQFQKLLAFIFQEYDALMQKTESPKASVFRLKLFIEKYTKRGFRMKKPQGKDFEIRPKKNK